jgi:hypothetical protein
VDNLIGLAAKGIGQGIHVVEYSPQQFEADRIFVDQMEIYLFQIDSDYQQLNYHFYLMVN